MNKRMIIIFLCSLSNILGNNKEIIHYNLQDSRYLINSIFDNSKSSGIELQIDKFGLKFIAVNDKLSKNNKHVVLSLSRNYTDPRAIASLYMGGNITIGDSTNPIIIAPNNTITWPSQLEINILGINSEGKLITTNGMNTNNQLGEPGYNQIICNPNTAITISSKAPANGDIIFHINPDTNGNFKFFGKNINLIDGITLLGINSNNNMTTTEIALAYIGNLQGNYISVDNRIQNQNKINEQNQNIEISAANQGNIVIQSAQIDTPKTGDYAFLGINSNNQLITMNNNETNSAPIYCNDLLASGIISLGSFIPGNISSEQLNQNIGANISINNSDIDGIIFNGSVYMNNSGFILPGLNQTTPLIIDNTGKIGILLSSEKYKTNITEINISPETFNMLRPCQYNYNNKTNNELQNEAPSKQNLEFGLIAEELYAIPELRSLVIFDREQKPLSTKYNSLHAITINQIQHDRKINKINYEKNRTDIQELYSQIKNLENIIQKLEKAIKELKKN